MAEGARLESVYTATYRGFESLPHRQIKQKGLSQDRPFCLSDDEGLGAWLDRQSSHSGLPKARAPGREPILPIFKVEKPPSGALFAIRMLSVLMLKGASLLALSHRAYRDEHPQGASRRESGGALISYCLMRQENCLSEAPRSVRKGSTNPYHHPFPILQSLPPGRLSVL